MCRLVCGDHMATIAESAIPAEELALYETLERRPDMVFEIDRVVAHNTTYVVPFVRATRGEFEGLTDVIEEDPSVAEVDLLAEVEDECFYRMVWSERAQVVGYMVAGQGATVQEARLRAPASGTYACSSPSGAASLRRANTPERATFRSM